MMIFPTVLLALITTAPLLCLLIYIYLASRGDSELLYSSVDTKIMTLRGKVFLGMAAIGLLICIFQGVDAMLYWMPNWGWHDEEGDFIHLRNFLATGATLFAGIPLVVFIDRATHNIFSINILSLQQKELTRIIEGYDSLFVLNKIADEYSKRLEAEESQLYGKGVSSQYAYPAGQRALVFRRLLTIVNARREVVKGHVTINKTPVG